jgi:hypothetical protein
VSQPISVDTTAASAPVIDVPKEKPRFSVYTMMLILSFFFVTIATVLMAYELNRYGSYPWWNTSAATQTVAPGG